MNMVLVQHNNQNRTKYCFAVPEHLVPHIESGVRVVCDTRRGNMPGRVVSQIMSGEEADIVMERRHATVPLKNIMAVVKEIDISNVKIPIYMEISTPRTEKIARREHELDTIGCVRTKVEIGEDGVLRDGYIAYLVCRNRGMTSIPVAVNA